MKSLNSIQLIGHVGSDPELNETGGKMVSKFSVATSEEWLDKSTLEKVKNTEWHKIVCFNKLAEIVNKYLKKGARIYVSGKLKTSAWQDINNENRSTTEVIADELIMLDSKSQEN
ncbi:MAG: single-stranded DNA-binding protein [Gammaproteobacteria bacterium]|nr:single-stranded DNA-binding protein [Gammaproteobacteria bacterium]